MTIKFALNILGYHLGALDIRIEMDSAPESPGLPHKPTFFDKISDYSARRWVARHA